MGELGAESGISYEFGEIGTQVLIIVGGRDEGNGSHNFGNGPTSGGHDGEARSHGLNQTHPVLFLPGRSSLAGQEKDVSLAVDRRHILVGSGGDKAEVCD